MKLYYNENIAGEKNPEIAGYKVKKRKKELKEHPYFTVSTRPKKIFVLQDRSWYPTYHAHICKTLY